MLKIRNNEKSNDNIGKNNEKKGYFSGKFLVVKNRI